MSGTSDDDVANEAQGRAGERGLGRDEAQLDAQTAEVLQASRALLGLIARSVTPALDEVSMPQLRVLVLLAQEGPLRSGLVAERMGVHASTFTRNADRMVAGGWIRRTARAGNRPVVLIELTPAGRAIVEQVTERRRADLAAILEEVPSRSRHALVDALRAFAVAAGEPDARELATLAL